MVDDVAESLRVARPEATKEQLRLEKALGDWLRDRAQLLPY